VATGGRWEGLFLAADERGFWRVLAKTRGKPSPGELITLRNAHGEDDVQIRLAAKEDEGVWIVRPESDEEPFRLLERVGRVPLPPYIRGGEMVESDRKAYQTVYARTPGAIAAPTSGLHFTEHLLEKIREKGTTICYLTLHVGEGTFRPIETERLAEHPMHAEWGELGQSAIEQI
jgi:S-adenosylmethionine:tRNA ribosyltransferase-isomerase